MSTKKTEEVPIRLRLRSATATNRTVTTTPTFIKPKSTPVKHKSAPVKRPRKTVSLIKEGSVQVLFVCLFVFFEIYVPPLYVSMSTYYEH